jgi:hypothetical protein
LMQLAAFGTLHSATQDRLLQIISRKIHTVLSARTVVVGEEPAWSLFSISSGTECLVKNSSTKYWNNYVCDDTVSVSTTSSPRSVRR